MNRGRRMGVKELSIHRSPFQNAAKPFSEIMILAIREWLTQFIKKNGG